MPGPDHRLSKVTPCPDISRTKILSIAKANPVGDINDTIHSVADVSESSKNTWIKYSSDMIFTAKFPSIPAVCDGNIMLKTILFLSDIWFWK